MALYCEVICFLIMTHDDFLDLVEVWFDHDISRKAILVWRLKGPMSPIHLQMVFWEY